MAAALGVANVGQGTSSSGSGTLASVSLTTGTAVAAGSRIYLGVCIYTGSSTPVYTSVSPSGGLTWVLEGQIGNGALGDSTCTMLLYADAPSGLASSTTLTVNFSGGGWDASMVATSFTGVATTTRTAEMTNRTLTTTAWTTGTLATEPGGLVVGICGDGGGVGGNTNTVTSPSVEDQDYFGVIQAYVTLCHRIEAEPGSYAVAGTLGTAPNVRSSIVGASYAPAVKAQTVRHFNGVNTSGDYLDFDHGAMGAVNNGTIPLTMLILMKPLEQGVANDPYISIFGGTPNPALASLYNPAVSGELSWGSDDPADDISVGMNLTANDWQILGMTKVSGAAGMIRAHRKKLGSGSWSHTNIGTASGSSGKASTGITIARFPAVANTERTWCRVAVAAMWNSILSDANFETIEAAASTAAIKALNPDWYVDLNQTSVTQAIADLKDYTSAGGDQTARTGTTVIYGDAPAWEYLWPVRASDTFDRPNEAPLVTGNWVNTGDPFTAAFNLSSNNVIPSSDAADSCYYWGARSWNDNQFSRASLSVFGSSGGAGPGLCVRRHATLQTYYRLVVQDNAGTATCELIRFNNGGVTGMDTWLTPYADGDVYELRVDGQGAATHLYGFKNGLPIGDVLDDGSFGGAQLNSGYAGIAYSSAVGGSIIHDWEGGDQVTVAATEKQSYYAYRRRSNR